MGIPDPLTEREKRLLDQTEPGLSPRPPGIDLADILLRFRDAIQLEINAGGLRVVSTTAIDQVLVAGDVGKLILLTAGANAILPDPGAVGSGWWVDLKEAAGSVASSAVRFGIEDIDGSAVDVVLAPFEDRTLVTDGTNWWSN